MIHFLKPLHRNAVAVLHDTAMAAISFLLALWLRLGDIESLMPLPYVLSGCAAFSVICLGVFLSMRHYRGMWRYASLQDLLAIVKSVTLATAIFIPLLFLATRMEGYPRSAIAINWMLLIALLASPRLLYRIIRDKGFRFENFSFDWQQLTNARIPVLLIGAGDQAAMFLRHSAQQDTPYRVVGIISDDAQLHGRDLHGVRIMGGLDVLERVLDKLTRRNQRPHKILLASTELGSDQISDLLTRAEKSGLSLARIPSITQLQDSRTPPTLAPLAIEDVLGRPQRTRDLAAMEAFITGKRVLITGAGGSIGSEIARQVAGFSPAQILLLDHSETALYTIDKEIESSFASVQREAVLADVRDRVGLFTLCHHYQPEIIFHAAAVKHVPLAEAHPHEAVLTNILGTRNVADAACECGAEAMVMISTDKAVHPSSLMGATKRAAEHYCQSLRAVGTRVMIVRFGNVLGSAGSVVPLFRSQIERGGPVTVTHPEMTRYFMTIREAVELVLQAAASNQEEAALFVLDMGEPVMILDLAEQMIRLAGLRPYDDIPIFFSGLRAGEKLYEELFYASEAPSPTIHAGILKAQRQPQDVRRIHRLIEQLEKATENREMGRLLALLGELVPEYRNQGSGIRDQKKA
jgi:FlaA1/EpsC-like NDP-sugar epimerase